MDQDGMLCHRRDRRVGVLVVELSGSVRFPHIDQSLFGVTETLHFNFPFDCIPWPPAPHQLAPMPHSQRESARSAQIFLVHAALQNNFDVQRHLASARTHRAFRPWRCRHGMKSSPWREPDVPVELLRTLFGNVTKPVEETTILQLRGMARRCKRLDGVARPSLRSPYLSAP